MTKTEIAKQLALQKNGESSPGPLETPKIQAEFPDRYEFRRELVAEVMQEITHQLAPLSEALSVQGKEIRTCHQEFKATQEQGQRQLEGITKTAKTLLEDIGAAAARLRWKATTLFMLGSLLVGVPIGYKFCSWQQRPSGDKEAAVKWEKLQGRLDQLSPTRRELINNLIYQN